MNSMKCLLNDLFIFSTNIVMNYTEVEVSNEFVTYFGHKLIV